MNRFPHLAQRLFNVPLAITPDKAEIVMAALADRLGIARLFKAAGPKAISYDWDADSGENESEEPFDRVGPVAVIPVDGTLVAKSAYMRPTSGCTGYNAIRTAFGLALEDESVRAIVLDIDSPGGEVAGCFDLVDSIYRARGRKPIWAILTENAFSAAYAIASAADRICVPRTGGTGSVGVIALHVDFSQALAAAGIAVTLITYGDRKADGNEYHPLGKEALERFQADVDAMGELFVKTVARNRGLAANAVRATQARTYLGAAGVSIGFADQVAAPDQAFAALLASLGA